MKKAILEVYALAICFGSVVCFVTCSTIAGYSLIDIVKPDFTMYSGYFYKFQSNDAFWKYCDGRCGPGPQDENKPRPSEEDLTKERMASYVAALGREQHEGMQMLVRMLIIMLVDVLAFFSHWVIAKRVRILAAA